MRLFLSQSKKTGYQLSIDFGDLGMKRSSAQLTALYDPDLLCHKQIIAILNFSPKNIAGFLSECPVLGVYSGENEVILLQPGRTVNNGAKIG